MTPSFVLLHQLTLTINANFYVVKEEKGYFYFKDEC
jgi:hypothetical protein